MFIDVFLPGPTKQDAANQAAHNISYVPVWTCHTWLDELVSPQVSHFVHLKDSLFRFAHTVSRTQTIQQVVGHKILVCVYYSIIYVPSVCKCSAHQMNPSCECYSVLKSGAKVIPTGDVRPAPGLESPCVFAAEIKWVIGYQLISHIHMTVANHFPLWCHGWVVVLYGSQATSVWRKKIDNRGDFNDSKRFYIAWRPGYSRMVTKHFLPSSILTLMQNSTLSNTVK